MQRVAGVTEEGHDRWRGFEKGWRDWAGRTEKGIKRDGLQCTVCSVVVAIVV